MTGDISPGSDPYASLEALVRMALAEDIGPGDVTSACLIPEKLSGSASVIARSPLVVCGHRAAEEVCRQVDKKLRYTVKAEDGLSAESGAVLSQLRGPLRSILTAERTLLNFMQRLSGISTKTRSLRRLIGGAPVKLRDTRKTTPGFRALEKYAVAVGGGENHRLGLWDAFLIKNNHIDACGGDVSAAVRRCKDNNPHKLKVQVEVRSRAELQAALSAGPDSILLDNMTPDELRAAVSLVRSAAGGLEIELEASGGINESTIAVVSETGVDAVSLGALTHSAPAADISLRISEAD